MAFIGFLVLALILFLLFRLYIYYLEDEYRKEKYIKKPLKFDDEFDKEFDTQFHDFDEADDCIEDYEKYMKRMHEIWGGDDPDSIEPTESYCKRAIHIE